MLRAFLYTIFLIGFSLVGFNESMAQSFSQLTEDQKFELYAESCDKNQFANCYQLSKWYTQNKRLDPIEIRKIQVEMSQLKDKRAQIINDNPEDDISPEEKARYGVLSARLVDKNQEAEAKENALKMLNKACNGGEKVACRELNGTSDYKGSQILYYSALALIFLAIFLIAKTIFQDEDQFQAQEKLDDSKNSKDEIAKHGIILRYSRPFFKRYFSPIVSGMKGKKKFKDMYRRKLASAGLTNILTPEDFFAFKLFLIIGFPIVFMAVRLFLEETWPLEIIPIIGLIGFYYPDFWIKGKIQQRQEEIIQAMPFSVDMLALSVEAGLDFVAAMMKVIEKSKPNPLTEEFEILQREIKIGASRAEALRNLAWRIDLIQISSFCATLIAADSVGASIGPILKALALEIRQKKSSLVEKKGATAASKMLLPMVFLIIPAVILVIFSPIILEFVSG